MNREHIRVMDGFDESMDAMTRSIASEKIASEKIASEFAGGGDPRQFIAISARQVHARG